MQGDVLEREVGRQYSANTYSSFNAYSTQLSFHTDIVIVYVYIVTWLLIVDFYLFQVSVKCEMKERLKHYVSITGDHPQAQTASPSLSLSVPSSSSLSILFSNSSSHFQFVRVSVFLSPTPTQAKITALKKETTINIPTPHPFLPLHHSYQIRSVLFRSYQLTLTFRYIFKKPHNI